jgi:hypothetical protein
VPNTIAKVDLIRAAKESKKTITSGSKIGGVIVK